MSGEPEVLDDEYVRENPGWIRELYAMYQDQLADFARCIECCETEMTLEQVANWVEKQDTRIRIVDPVTAAVQEGDSWKADLKFMLRVKRAAKDGGYSILLSTHPKLGTKAPSLSALAGGAAYPRFSQCVIWLRSFDKPKAARVTGSGGDTETMEYRMSQEIRKARNGDGQGTDIAVRLNKQNLCIDELGIITSDD
jgi:hypothetical protein